MVRGSAALALASVIAMSTLAPANPSEERTVVVVLVDGFSGKLFESADTPVFDRLKREGVWSESLLPAFPSLSHTNWVSLSTGCWPERHGIVSNAFRIGESAPDFETKMNADTLLACQPINEVAEAQGVHVAALGWSGARSKTRGDLASVVRSPFMDWTPEWDFKRAGQVVEQLDRRDPDRPRLVLAYFNGPDTTQHETGMYSEATRAAVEHTDMALGVIVDKLSAMSAERKVTLLVVTDHGMTMVDQMINIAEILRRTGIGAKYISDGPLAFIHLDDPEQREEAIRRLSGDPKFQVVLPEAQPRHWHLGSSRRVGDLIFYTRAPYFFPMDHDMPSWLPSYGRWWPEVVKVPQVLRPIGMHGYAVEDQPEMRGIFFAWGSGIAKPKNLETPVRAIDLHPTVAYLLGIHPGVPHDGIILEDVLQ
ncbi:MAG: alkaline phosphatase family protein [Deltaproteobacteria bacterium]|nr:alkaline phosphatase family protein [Deltaproteobacteria bacterium]MBW2723873.1 alkaline phosphatase family protein [Deltaproteobacteria bacterium]